MASSNFGDMMKSRNVMIAVGVIVVLVIAAWAGGMFSTKTPKDATAPATTTEQPATTELPATTEPPATTTEQPATTQPPATTTELPATTEPPAATGQ